MIGWDDLNIINNTLYIIIIPLTIFAVYKALGSWEASYTTHEVNLSVNKLIYCNKSSSRGGFD